jgi:putative GTP pyrophosphokinase
MSLSKSQLDKLGEKLKDGSVSEEDLRYLNDYKLSFAKAHKEVITSIKTQLRLEPTGRSAKSTTSIADKLKRESIRLTQIQDIAGCRLIVEDLNGQERVTNALADLFPDSFILDRRLKPSHGYRAVHLVVSVDKKRVEVQVRTFLQHVWAELCERLSDTVDKSIKYGGGEKKVRELLRALSVEICSLEEIESGLSACHRDYDDISSSDLSDALRKELLSANLEMEQIRKLWGERRGLLIGRVQTILDKLNPRS